MGYTFNGVEVKTLAEFRGQGVQQDYKEIKAALVPGIPWKDPEFTASTKSLGPSANNPNFFWKRIKDIVPNPVFVTPNDPTDHATSRFDIMQGLLADCWFMVAIDAIAEKPELVQMVIPEDNTFDNDNSVFHFRFWRYNSWVDTVVDDLLPCYRTYDPNRRIITKVAFAGNRGNEFWIPLLEKAYAKFNESYSMLNLGVAGDGLEDLTGGLSFDLWLRSPSATPAVKVRGYVVDAYERGSLMTLGIMSRMDDTPGETKQANGLARGHAYAITGMGQVPFMGKRVTLVRIRNPWGNDFEWNGAWSDDSKEWETFDKEKVKALGLKRGDGEFWMSFEDMLENFDILSICHVTGDIVKKMSAKGSNPIYWRPHAFQGIWPGAGCANAVEIVKNTQYLLDLRSVSGKDPTVVIAVMNKDIRLTSKDTIKDNYFALLYKVKNPETSITGAYPASALISKELDLFGQPTFALDRESFDHYVLPPAVYVIIPIFGRWVGIPGTFLLRVYTDADSEMKELAPSPGT